DRLDFIARNHNDRVAHRRATASVNQGAAADHRCAAAGRGGGLLRPLLRPRAPTERHQQRQAQDVAESTLSHCALSHLPTPCAFRRDTGPSHPFKPGFPIWTSGSATFIHPSPPRGPELFQDIHPTPLRPCPLVFASLPPSAVALAIR